MEYANLAIRGRLLRPILREQVPVALDLRPDLVSLVGGGNDILRPAVDVVRLARDLEAGVVRLREAGIDVLLGTGVDAAGSPLVRATRNRVGVFNAHVWSIARRHGAYVLDLWGMRALMDWRMWADDRIHLTTEGHARVAQAATTIVRSTNGGMVLDVPVEVGNSVIQANNFNEGTTIASIADMGDMIFEGKVDESEVGKIRPGMALVLTIGALPDKKIDATLEHIAPKGVEEEGAIQFEIRAAVKPQADLFLRANYSANADIVLDKREQVLAIDEGLLQFDGDKPYVEVETAPQVFERRDVVTGLSDGLKIEIVSGLTESDKIKNPNPDAEAPTAE